MISHVVRSAVVTITVGCILAGCGEPTGPDAFAGTYRLLRYEGQPLPVFYVPTNGGTISLVDQRIVLGDDGQGVATNVYEESPTGRRIPVSRSLDYVVRGSRIEITLLCFSFSSLSTESSCAAGPHLTGERSGNGLALAPPTSSKPASTYDRVR